MAYGSFDGHSLIFTAASHPNLPSFGPIDLLSTITAFLEEGPGTQPMTNGCKSWSHFSIGSITHSNLIARPYLNSCCNVNKSKHKNTMMHLMRVGRQHILTYCYLQVLAKWGEYSHDVQFILQRSPLDSSKTTSPAPSKADTKSFNSSAGANLSSSGAPHGGLTQPAIWKSPPSSLGMGGKPPLGGRPDGRPGAQDSAARLSPDSGQGSDPTGSDTSNFSDQEKALRGGGAVARHPPSSLPPSG